VSAENEVVVIDLFFSSILSAEMNVKTKSRSLLVLLNATKNLSRFENELPTYLESQIENSIGDYRKRVINLRGKLSE
jgi:hypothetical protein